MKKKIIILFIIVTSFLSCNSSPSTNHQEPIITILEEIEIDLDLDEGKDLLSKAVNTYASRYTNYIMEIRILDIQSLIDRNFSGYQNKIKIYKVVKDFTYYVIESQHNTMLVKLGFSDEPFLGGISSKFSWNYNNRYSNGDYERQQAEKRHQQEWNSYFDSIYNEAILKLTIERRKVPEEKFILSGNIRVDLSDLEYHKLIKALWYGTYEEEKRRRIFGDY